MYSSGRGITSSPADNRTSKKKFIDRKRNSPLGSDTADVFKYPTAKRQGNLGSSFGGVIFRPHSLPYIQRAESHDINQLQTETSQQTKPYIHDTSSTVFLDGHDHLFHCQNTHSFMANNSIDRGCACHIGLYKRTNNNTRSNCYSNEKCIDERNGVPYTRPLGSNCDDFSDISRYIFVTSRDRSKSAYKYCKHVYCDTKCCAHTEDSTRGCDICADCDSICVNRFIMGDDDCLKEHEHNGNISTPSSNTESGNCPAGSSGSGNLVENFTESRDNPENFTQICQRWNGYTDSDSRGQSHVDSDIDSENIGKCLDSARNSMDSTASMVSDNAFFPSRSIMNSISDVTSISSMSSCQSTARDTITSRKRFELRHGNHLDHEGSDYVTPSQRKEKELKDLRKERLQLMREQQEKDVEIAALRACMETVKAQVEEEKAQEMAELAEKLKLCERQKFEEMEQLLKAQEELARMDAKYTDLKCKLAEKEEKFQEYLFDMYKKGQLAAMFEREQELEMLASSQKGRVSVRELTRKLSRTELELAKWQGLKLEESYSVTERPETQAEATLSFLKDSFFHFVTSKTDSEDHLRAMITIFHYSDAQMAKIRKGLDDFKRLDRKRLSLK